MHPETLQVEAQVAKLSEVLDLVLPGASAAICRAPPLQLQLPNQEESDDTHAVSVIVTCSRN